MTGQIDIGWAAPPFGLKEIEEHKIRLLARASDLPVVRGQTIRVLATRADVLDKRKDAIARYMDAYRETVDYIYGNDPKAILAFAEVGGISPEIARRTREMFDRPQLQPDEIKGLDIMMPEAVKLKFLAAPLTADQIRELIQIPPPH
jgi:NitT/TauT family transport system substrate-binding protein